MDWLNIFYATLHVFALDVGRVGGTALVVFTCLLAIKSWQAYLNRKGAAESSEALRERLVWARNGIWVLGLLAIAAIWASKIAGFALSVAALAGAILLVSKELLMCFMGYALITFTRPYRIGDFIEVGAHAGRVIDLDGFSTTLAETGLVHQLTGKTLTIPNSLLLSTPVRNISATGAFMVDLYTVAVPFDIDMTKAEECALAAADAATCGWREEADRHLQRIEAKAFIDLPSSRPKVLWASGDSKQHLMTIRFSCPVEERVVTEQAIFRAFWAKYRADSSAGAASQ